MEIAFKPMKGFWKGVLMGRISPDENGRFEWKLDHNKNTEQLHFRMNRTELMIFSESIINSLLPHKEERDRVDAKIDLEGIKRIQNHIKERLKILEAEGDNVKC